MLQLLKNRTLLSFSLAHFSVDLCAGALPVIMVYLTGALNLSIAQASFALGVYTMSSSLAQPLFGYLSDRVNSKWQSALGLGWLAVFQGLTGFATSYVMLLVLVGLGGLGSAAFHPHGASGASKSGGVRKISAMAVFMLGGNSGFAAGPLLAGLLLESLGLHGSIVIAIVGVALVPLVYLAGRNNPSAANTPSTNTTSTTNTTERALNFNKLAVMALLLIMFFRAWVQSGTTSFVPVYFTRIAGLSVPDAARIASINLFALAFGGLVGGMLADRFGGKRVLISAYLIYAPATYLLFSTQGWVPMLIAPLAGFVAGASWPPLIVMSQELFPKNAGVGSGLALGFAFAMGGIGQSITGWLAEPHQLGLQPSLLMLAVLPLLAAIFVVLLPTRKRAELSPTQMRNLAQTTAKQSS
jgi:FSR family fosmidomycin resistance protein-like MFS transporter